MPQQVAVPTLETAVTKFPSQGIVTGTTNVEAFQTLYTGGTGLLVAIIVGYIVARLYVFLNKKI